MQCKSFINQDQDLYLFILYLGLFACLIRSERNFILFTLLCRLVYQSCFFTFIFWFQLILSYSILQFTLFKSFIYYQLILISILIEENFTNMDSQFRLEIHSPNQEDLRRSIQNKIQRNSLGFVNPFQMLAPFKKPTPRESKRMAEIFISMAKKVKQILPTSVYFMQLIFTLLNCFIVIPMFFVEYSDAKFFFIMASLISTFIFMVSVNFYLTTFKDMLLMTFLADAILLATLTSVIGFVGLAKIADTGRPYDEIIVYFVPVLLMVGAGHLRISFKRVRYTIWQIIGLKFCIYSCAICYFMIGAYIMFVNWQATSGFDKGLDARMKDFSLLFTFGSFSLYEQLCDVLSQFDQTSQLKFQYQMQDQELSQESESQQQERQKQMSQMSDSILQKSRQMEIPLSININANNININTDQHKTYKESNNAKKSGENIGANYLNMKDVMEFSQYGDDQNNNNKNNQNIFNQGKEFRGRRVKMNATQKPK